MFKKKRKTEAITIEIPEVVRDKASSSDDTSFYSENVVDLENKHTLRGYATFEDKLNKINHDYAEFLVKKAEILENTYIFKIFAPSVTRDDKYNYAKLTLDKDVNKLKGISEDISRRLRKTESLDNLTDNALEELFLSLNNLFDFSKDIIRRQNSFRMAYYGSLKMSSLTVCRGKSYEELEKLSKEVELVIIEYGSVEKAKDYIYYNSGNLITEVVDLVTKCIVNTNSAINVASYNQQYFVNSDAVLTLSFNDWIELFNKLRFVSRIIKDTNEIDLLRYNKKYRELEISYIILLIANEIESKRRNASL